MTLYLVTSGEHSDYGLRAAFSTRELAAAYIEEATKAERGYCGPYEIEEWLVDEEAGKVVRPTYCALIFLESGEIKHESDWTSLAPPKARSGPGRHLLSSGAYPEGYQATSYVSAEHARKLAVEWWQGWLRGKDEPGLEERPALEAGRP